MPATLTPTPYWVFGYGSLIWKPPPHAVEQRSGYVKHVVRRFAQSSIDHRGVPDAPGRVVTVIDAKAWHALEGSSRPYEGSDDKVWGVAYRIADDKADVVAAYLEHREKNGYTAHEVPVYRTQQPGNAEEVAVDKATIWIGKLDNPAFVGFEPLPSLAATILVRSGPSGPNKDYLYRLAEAVRALWPHVEDEYLFELEAKVKELEAALPEKTTSLSPAPVNSSAPTDPTPRVG